MNNGAGASTRSLKKDCYLVSGEHKYQDKYTIKRPDG